MKEFIIASSNVSKLVGLKDALIERFDCKFSIESDDVFVLYLCEDPIHNSVTFIRGYADALFRNE